MWMCHGKKRIRSLDRLLRVVRWNGWQTFDVPHQRCLAHAHIVACTFSAKINDVAASNLRANSKSYLKNAKQLSWDAMMRKWAPVIAVVVVLLIVLLYIFYL